MKTAALSMGPALEVYSWQEPGSIYTMMLDVNEISGSRANSIELPEPRLIDVLSSQIAGILTKAMVFPKDVAQQELLATYEDQLLERLGQSGTLVFVPECDRLSSKTARSLAEHATRDMARIYRRQLGEGLHLYIALQRHRTV